MLFQEAPDPFNGVVLAVIRRIVGQFHSQSEVVDKVDDSSHELGAAAMVFRSIIQIEFEGGDSGKAVLDAFPPLAEAINQTIACDLGCDCIDEQLCAFRE